MGTDDRKLTSAADLVAGELRGQATALRVWANRLHVAMLGGDWHAVQLVQSDLATTALTLESMASRTQGCPDCRRAAENPRFICEEHGTVQA